MEAAIAASLTEAIEAENHNISKAVLMSQQDIPDQHDHGIRTVWLLRYGRGDTERFRDRLLHGPDFQQCRAALKAGGHSSVLPEGANVCI